MLIVGVKQVIPFRIECLIVCGERNQNEGLKKPADMSNVPLCRADIWHALNHIIFNFQRLTKLFADRSDGKVILGKCFKYSLGVSWF